MILDEAIALLTKVLEQLAEVERALDQLRQPGCPQGSSGGDSRSSAAVEFAKSAVQTVAAKSIEVARVALLLLSQFDGNDTGSRARPQKRRPKKH